MTDPNELKRLAKRLEEGLEYLGETALREAMTEVAAKLRTLSVVKQSLTTECHNEPGYGLTAEQVALLLSEGLKPEEIGGSAELQHARVGELVRWFARLARQQANPKWAVSHAFELAYFIATNAGNRHIDLQPIREASYKEGAMVSPADRGMLERIGFLKPLPAPKIERKARVFIDMDGVIVDFDAYKAANGLTSDEVKRTPGAYLAMPAIPGAIEAVRSVIGMGFEVWIATKPPTGVPGAYSDKAAWIMEHLPELKRRIIVTHDKGLLGAEGDFLCDDRPHKANCERFAGTLLRFVDGYHWPEALNELAGGARG